MHKHNFWENGQMPKSKFMVKTFKCREVNRELSSIYCNTKLNYVIENSIWASQRQHYCKVVAVWQDESVAEWWFDRMAVQQDGCVTGWQYVSVAVW